ncbi:MAG: cytochrome c family protein [Nitrospirota bacterium]
MKRLILFVSLSAVIVFASTVFAEEKGSYVSYKKCGGCHISQRDSWLDTTHAKAFDSLKPKVKANEKKKAKLDPNKDYTNDKDCIGCHTTGYGEKGGYKPDMPEKKAKFLQSVGCEMCHGAGSLYRKKHKEAGASFKKTKQPTPRKELADTGQISNYEEACAGCHLNYKGSPWKGAKEPYTPFTPSVDPKYKLDFEKAVKETGKGKGKGKGKAIHEHFKLRDVFKGEPVSKIRAELQKTAKEPKAGEEEEE